MMESYRHSDSHSYYSHCSILLGAVLFLAILSVLFSLVGLLSEFTALGRLPPEYMLSFTFTKVAIYVAFNLLRLMLRGKRYRKKPLRLTSFKTREYCVQIIDDLLGAVPTSIAIASLSVPEDMKMFSMDTNAILGLSIMAPVVKLVRIIHELLLICRRAKQKNLVMSIAAVNGLCLLSSLLSFCYLILFNLKAQMILDASVEGLWFLPVMHTPLLAKPKSGNEDNYQYH